MRVQAQIEVKDSDGNTYKLCKGTIEHLTVFAADGVGRGVDNAENLASEHGGTPNSWKHVKGMGFVKDKNENKREADLHWFESPEVGQVGWKIKQFRDEMTPKDEYW